MEEIKTETQPVEEVKESTSAVETKTDSSNAQSETELFAKLDEILEKRSNGIIKSILKDNGTEDTEVADILTRYKASKQAKKSQDAEEVAKLKTRNAELSKKIFDAELDKKAAKVAEEIGLSKDKLSYAMKLADMTKAINGDTINGDELKAALEKVLSDIPEFKHKPDNLGAVYGVRKAGVERKEQDPTDPTDMLRKAIGIKSK